MRRHPFAAVAAAVCVWAMPSAAEASAVQANYPSWSFEAESGEANDVTTSQQGLLLHVRDTGSVIKAGPGCRSVDEHEVACDASGYGRVKTHDGDDRVAVEAHSFVELGDGNDRVDGAFTVVAGDGADTIVGNIATRARWDGGPGDDVLQATSSLAEEGFRFDPEIQFEGGEGADLLVGGDGHELLIGGPGDDTLLGGGGQDQLVAAGWTDAVAAAGDDDDVIDGGSGVDVVTYAGRAADLVVNLADSAPDGAAGEADRLSGLENVAGGEGDDVITGDAADNDLMGGPGHDVIRAGDGADELTGGWGFDRLDGGAADDALDASGSGRWYWYDADLGSTLSSDLYEVDATYEQLRCGDGADVVETRLDDPAEDCETTWLHRYWYGRLPFALRPARVTRKTIAFRVPCTRGLWERRGRCSGRMTITGRNGRKMRRFSIPNPGGVVRMPRPYDDWPARDRIRFDVRYGPREGPAGYVRSISTYMTLDLPPVPLE